MLFVVFVVQVLARNSEVTLIVAEHTANVSLCGELKVGGIPECAGDLRQGQPSPRTNWEQSTQPACAAATQPRTTHPAACRRQRLFLTRRSCVP